MNDACRETITLALAEHLDVDPLAIEGSQDLENDWGLDALDLVLLAIRIEDRLEIRVPLARLETARTVGDLERVVRTAYPPPAPRAVRRSWRIARSGARFVRRRDDRRTRRSYV
jgi:acyl carrier protein